MVNRDASDMSRPSSNPPRVTDFSELYQFRLFRISDNFRSSSIPELTEEGLENFFRHLDRDGSGKIDIHELSEALQKFGISSIYADHFLQRSDSDNSGDIDIAEFCSYIREHEKNLKIHFSEFDKNQDGKIDLEELMETFKELGLQIDEDEAKSLLARMDANGDLHISFSEWRNFLLLAPVDNLRDLYKFWTNHVFVDVGEDLYVPKELTVFHSGMWWRHLVSGGVAGAVSRTFTAPFDRVKVFLQVQSDRRTFFESVRLLLREGGFRSFWRGNGINVLKIAPESAIKFAAYEKLKRLFRGDSDRQLRIEERFVAGACAGSISQSIIYPMEVLKTRMALRKTGEFDGFFDAVQKIYKRGGLLNFYRGYLPNMLGIIPYAGIDLAVYETMKRNLLKNHNHEESPNVLVLLTCSGMSSSLGQFFAYPLVLVRTRLQVQDRGSGGQYPDTMTSLLKQIVRQQGIAGLYRGIAPNFIKLLPAVSISYIVYEYTNRALGTKMT